MRGIRNPDVVERNSNNDEVAGVNVVLPIPTFCARVAADVLVRRATRIFAFMILVTLFVRCNGNLGSMVMVSMLFLDERLFVFFTLYLHGA
jgi:hypothetical protein